jgi:hypothetical protein
MTITITQIIALLGGWSVVLVGLSSWTSKLLTERFLSKWRMEEQATIEELRNSFSRENRVLEAAISGAQLSQDASHQKRIAGIERLWSTLLAIRSSFSEVVFFFEIFLPREYESVLKKDDPLAKRLSQLNDEWIVSHLEPISALETERPYLGETLWSRISIYQSFLGRLAVLIVMGKRKGHIQNWAEDKGIRQLLSVVLPEKTVDIMLGKTGTFPALRWAIASLESLILEETSLILSGRRSAIESFENAKDLQRSIAELKEPAPGSDLQRFR